MFCLQVYTELDEGLLAGFLPQATERWLQARRLVTVAWQYHSQVHFLPWHRLQLVTLSHWEWMSGQCISHKGTFP